MFKQNGWVEICVKCTASVTNRSKLLYKWHGFIEADDCRYIQRKYAFNGSTYNVISLQDGMKTDWKLKVKLTCASHKNVCDFIDTIYWVNTLKKRERKCDNTQQNRIYWHEIVPGKVFDFPISYTPLFYAHFIVHIKVTSIRSLSVIEPEQSEDFQWWSV